MGAEGLWGRGAACRIEISPGSGSTDLLRKNGLVLQAEIAELDKPLEEARGFPRAPPLSTSTLGLAVLNFKWTCLS